MPFQSQYSQRSPGTLISELDLSVRVSLAVSTTGALVYSSKRGPLGAKFYSSYPRFEALNGKPDPSVSFGHDCAGHFLQQSSQMWGNRVINGALYSGLTYFRDKHSNLGSTTTPRRIVRKFPVGSPTAYTGGGQNVVLLSFSAALVTLNKFNMSVTDGATTTAISEVTYTTSHNNTMGLIAASIATAVATFATGGSCAVHSEGVTANSFIIAIYMPAGVSLSFTNPVVTLGASQATATIDTEAKLFDVIAENPGVWGDDVGVKLTNFDAGTRARWRITLGGAMASGHSIQVDVNDTTITQAYSTNNDTTLASFATQLEGHADILTATVTSVPGALNNDRSIVIVALTPHPDALVLSGLQVTGSNAPAAVLLETLVGVEPTHEFDFEVFERPNVLVPVERYRATMAKRINTNGTQTALDYRINNDGGAGSDRIRIVFPEASRDDIFYPSLVGSVYTIDSTVNFLGGGDDGAAVLNSQISAGWDAFKNRELIPVRILINAGYTDVAVQQKMVALAEYRNDAVAILDMPSDKQATQAAYTHRLQDLNIDSSFGAIYTPDLLIPDDNSDERRYVPPSGRVAAAYAYSDANSAVWFAPAGLNRGKLSQVLGLRQNYELGDRELLSPAGINCIIDKLGVGPVIWDEVTLQSKQSVLSGVHARRLLNMLEIAYSEALDYAALFEPNNIFTRYNVRQIGESLLAPIKRDGGLYDYQVVCDEDNNPPELIDQDVLRVDMYLQITRTAKRVLLRAVLTPTGANFSVLIGFVNGQAPRSAAAA